MTNSRILLIALSCVALAVALTGCGDNATTANKPEPATKAKAPPPTVEECLERPDTLESIEQVEADFWRATFEGSTMLVRVHKMGSTKEAKRAAKEATEINRAVGGAYFLAGPMKGTIPAEGDSATLVQDTLDDAAKCLAEVE